MNDRLRPPSIGVQSASKRSHSFGTADRAKSLRRYGSETSLNTPNRMSATPMSARRTLRPSMFPSVDRSRRCKPDQCERILDTLQSYPEFFAELNLQGGLRAMTAKQFITIMRFFMDVIGGGEAKATADPLNDILSFLKAVGFPYSMTKSAMKTPNAPHTFDQIVALLLWLCDFVDPANDLEMEVGDDLPNAEFMADLNRAMRDGFQLWNDQQEDQFEELKDSLANLVVKSKSSRGAGSIDELKQKTKELRAQVDQLKKVPVEALNDAEFQVVESLYAKHELDEFDLAERVKRSRDQLGATQRNLSERKEKVGEAETRVRRIKGEIKSQKVNKTEFEEIIRRCTELRIEVDCTRELLQIGANEKSSKMIKLACLLNEKSKTMVQCRIHLGRFAEMLQKVQATPVDINDFNVSLQSSPDHLSDVKSHLRNLFGEMNSRKKKLLLDIKKSENECEVLGEKLQVRKRIHDELDEQLTEALANIKSKEFQAVKEEEREEKKIIKLQRDLADSEADKQRVLLEVTKMEDRIRAVAQDVSKLLADFEKQAEGILEQKQDAIESMDKVLGGLERLEHENSRRDADYE